MAEVILFVNAGTSFVFAVNSYNFAPSSFFGSFFLIFLLCGSSLLPRALCEV